jgi:hypothetical protein
MLRKANSAFHECEQEKKGLRSSAPPWSWAGSAGEHQAEGAIISLHTRATNHWQVSPNKAKKESSLAGDAGLRWLCSSGGIPSDVPKVAYQGEAFYGTSSAVRPTLQVFKCAYQEKEYFKFWIAVPWYTSWVFSCIQFKAARSLLSL